MLVGLIRNPDLTCVGPGQRGRVGQKPGCCQALPAPLLVVFIPKWVDVLADLRQTSFESAHWRRMCEVFFLLFMGVYLRPLKDHIAEVTHPRFQGTAEVGKTYIPPSLKNTFIKGGGCLVGGKS